LVFVAANDNARAGINRSAPHHLFLERGVLEYHLSNADAQPLTMFIASYSSPEGPFEPSYQPASFLAVAPIMVLGWLTQKQLVRGLTFGAVK